MSLCITLILCAMLLSLIIGALMLEYTPWYWCPKCRRYHSELGYLDPGKAPSGRVAGTRCCDVCK